MAGRAGLVLAGFLLLPFAVFAHVAPFVSGRTLGSDYMIYSVPQQLLLQFSLANGSFPLYLPGFAGGLPAVAATQGQLFHPISHLAALLPGYWDGHAFDLFTVLNLLSLGFAQWACWRLLRELAVDAVLAFVVSFVTVFNLRMLSLFDYGASLQAWTAAILLCVALARVVLHGPDVVRCACVALATYLLLCSGHPQMAYLGFGGAVLALGCMTLLLPVLVPDGACPPRGPALAACTASLVAGILLSSAYLLPFVLDFLPGAAQRMGQDFSWVYTPFGTRSATSLLHSVFRPFSSDVQGSFAGPAPLAVPLLLPVLVAVRRPPLAVLATWTAALLVLALALAETLPLYFLAWKLVPMFAAFRAPGRVTMMAPFLLLLVLAWLCRAARVPLCLGGRTFDVAPLALVALVAAVVYAAYALVSTPQLDALELAPPARIAEIPPIVVRAVWLLGIASLAALAAYAQRPGRAAAALLVVLVLAQTTLVLRFGTWLTDARPSTTWSEQVRRHRLRVGFSKGDPGAGMTPAILLERRKALGPANQPTPLARLFRDVRPVASRDEAFAILRGREPNVATLEGTAMEAPPGGRGAPPQGYVRLLHASFNRFVFGVRTPAPALLALGQPYARNWRAIVDGAERPVGVANGAFVGVPVPAGETVVELRYASRAARAGMRLGVVTAWAIALVLAARIGRRGSGRGVRVIAAVAVTLLAAGGLLAWERSLYAGRHLGTSFEWKTPGWGGAPPSQERAAAP
ncbi:MAG: hypothetical protein U0842_05380 [Candidatus Binatia bacterium]